MALHGVAVLLPPDVAVQDVTIIHWRKRITYRVAEEGVTRAKEKNTGL